MLINHSHKTSLDIFAIDGEPLWGERLVYDRIVKDCTDDSFVWHMFYDIHLPLPINGKAEIQIDFFLLCPRGGVIIEVKGGDLEIVDGKYVNYCGGQQRTLKESPFYQVDSYKWAIINNHLFNKDEVFLTTMCAFPCATFSRTSMVDSLDLSHRMWNKSKQDNSDISFAKFCLELIEFDQNNKGWSRQDFTEREMSNIIAKFAPTISLSKTYSESSLPEILSWLKADNIDLIDSLYKNRRIICPSSKLSAQAAPSDLEILIKGKTIFRISPIVAFRFSSF